MASRINKVLCNVSANTVAGRVKPGLERKERRRPRMEEDLLFGSKEAV